MYYLKEQKKCPECFFSLCCCPRRKLLLGMRRLSFSKGQIKHRPGCLVTASSNTFAAEKTGPWHWSHCGTWRWEPPAEPPLREPTQNNDGEEGGLSPYSTGGGRWVGGGILVRILWNDLLLKVAPVWTTQIGAMKTTNLMTRLKKPCQNAACKCKNYFHNYISDAFFHSTTVCFYVLLFWF